MNCSQLIRLISNSLEESKNDNKATGMRAYMKDRYSYLGLTAPVRKDKFKMIWSEHKDFIIDQWPALVTSLWKMDYREYQYIAMDVIRKIENKLIVDDLPIIEQLITSKSWWDTVDFLASHGVGKILQQDKKLLLTTTERYINSDNIWLQRTALIFQLFYKKDTDAELLTAMIDHTLGSKEFFVNKAAGWALRQYSRVDPQFVADYVDLQRPLLSTITIREASKYL